MFSEKFNRFLVFASFMRLEVATLLACFVLYVKRVPTDQLIQDKICVEYYDKDKGFCHGIPELKREDDVEGYKSMILKDSAEFTLYHTMISTIPAVFWALFLGSWMDKYIHARKFLLVAFFLGSAGESAMLLLNSVYFRWDVNWALLSFAPYGSMGGSICLFTTIWSYVAVTTPPKWRALRMTVVEIAIFASTPLATTVSGWLLVQNPAFGDGIYNYSFIFCLSTVVGIAGVVWCLLTINQEKERIRFYEMFGPKEDIENNNIKMEMKVFKQETRSQTGRSKDVHPLRLLIDLDNVREMFVTCLKKRPNHVRCQIWLLFASMCIFILAHQGPVFFMFQFAQRVYDWNAETYSFMSSAGLLLQSFASLTLVPFLIKVVRITDPPLAMIGIISYWIQALIRGLWLEEMGYYVSSVVGLFGGVASVGMRSHCSKIVEQNEIGKVFSLMGAIDATAPLTASLLFTFIFKATMDTMPGAIFLVKGFFLLIPLASLIWIDVYTKVPDNKKSTRNKKLASNCVDKKEVKDQKEACSKV